MATSVRKSVVAWPVPAMASGAAAQPTPIEAAVVVPVAWPGPAAGVGAIAWPTPSASAGPRAGAPGAPQLAGQTTEQPRSPKHAESLCQRGARVSAQARQRPPTRDRVSKPRRGSQAPRQKATCLPTLAPCHAAATTASIMDALAWPQHCVQVAKATSPKDWQQYQLALHHRPWTLTTCFSGMECAGVAATCVDSALAAAGSSSRPAFVLGQACETDAACAQLLRAWRPHRCVLSDVCSWAGRDIAPCYVHGLCRVLRGDINVSGPPCVDFSSLGKRRRFLGKSMAAHVAWAKERRRRLEPIVVHECVPQFPLSWLEGQLGDLYDWEAVVLDSRFCLGVRRKRQYAVGFLRGRAQWKRPGVTLASAVRPYLRRTSLAADAFFMASDAACRKSAAQQRRKTNTDRQATSADAAPGPSRAQRARLAEYLRRWPRLRVADLDSNPAKRPRKCLRGQPLFAISTHSTLLWDVEKKRFMLPSERVVAIGYPHRDFPDMFQISGQLGMGVCDAPRVDMCSPRAQGRMAGNAMALPSIGTLLFTLRFHACLK